MEVDATTSISRIARARDVDSPTIAELLISARYQYRPLIRLECSLILRVTPFAYYAQRVELRIFPPTL
jgi:hypothetical protein